MRTSFCLRAGIIAFVFFISWTTNSVQAQVTLVTWNFPNNPDNATADGGIGANTAKTISVVGANTAIAFGNAGATTRAASSQRWDVGNGTKYWHVSFSTSGYQSITVSSKQNSGDDGPRNFKLQMSLDNTSWSDVPGGAITVAANWTAGVLTNLALPGADNKANVYLRWIMTSDISVDGGAVGTGAGAAARSLIDDIVVSGCPTSPAAPAASPATSANCRSFVANWPNAGASSYRLDVSTDPSFSTYVPGFQDVNVGNATSYPVGGLQASTTYYYRVRAVYTCSISPSSASITANTTASCGYCYGEFDGGCSSYHITNVTFAGINNSTGCAASMYTYNTSPVGAVQRCNTYALSATANGAVYFLAWIDYNDDGIFSPAECIFNGNSQVNSINPNITISGSAKLDTLRLRVKIARQNNQGPADACLGQNDWGETEDYNLVVGDTTGNFILTRTADECNKGAEVFTINGSTGQAISWESSADGSTWGTVGAGTSYNVPAVTSTTYYRAKVTGSTCYNVIAEAQKLSVLPSATPSTICTGGTSQLNAVYAGSASSFSTSPGADANDEGSMESTLSVTGVVPHFMSKTTIDRVCLNVANTADLVFTLVAPDNTEVRLASNVGSGTEGFTNTCFSPTATTSITSSATPFTGTFKAEGDLQGFADGNPANGTWKLRIDDNSFGGFTGNLGSWSITFRAPTIYWTPPTYLTDPNIKNPIASPPSTITYTAHVNYGLPCEPAESVTVTMDPGPPAPTVVDTTRICSGQTATINATVSSGVVKWYATETGGSPFFTGTSYTTSVLSADTAFFLAGNTGSCDTYPRKKTYVKVRPLPTVNAGSDQTVCENQSVTITATGAVTYSWDQGLGAGASKTFTATTTKTYTVTGTDANGCQNTDQVVITVNPLPAKPTVADTSICPGTTATLTATAPGGTYKWYKTATGATLFFTGNPYTTSTLFADTTVYIEVTDANGCTSATRDNAKVTVVPAPAQPTVTDTTKICSGQTATITATTTGANVIRWYDQATGGTKFFEGTTYTTTALTSDSAFYLDAYNGTCPSSPRKKTYVKVNPLPTVNAGADQEVCDGQNATLTATGATTYSWSTGQTGATITVTPAAPSQTYTVTGTDGNGCQNTDNVTVTVNALPAAPTLADTTICPGTAATLSPTAPGGTYRWYAQATGGSPFFTGSPYTTSILMADTTLFVEAVNGKGCVSARSDVNVILYPMPADPQIEPDTVCVGQNTTLTITGPAGGTFTWYTLVTGGTLFNTGTTYTTSNLTADTTFYIENTDAQGCKNIPRKAVTVKVEADPLPPVASDVTACPGYPATLTASGADNYKWYDAATGGTLAYTGNPYTTPPLTADTNFYVEAISNRGCVSGTRTKVHVTVTLPDAPTVADVYACYGETPGVTPTAPGVTYHWYDDDPGTEFFEGTTYTTTPVYGDTTFYVETEDAQGCRSNTKTPVTVFLKPAPAEPEIYDVLMCSGDDTTLTPIGPGGPGVTYRWYDDVNATTPFFTGLSYTTTKLTGDSTFYVETVGANGCPSLNRTPVLVAVNPPPPPPFVENDTICSGEQGNMTAISGDPNDNFNWYTSSTGGALVYTGSNYITSPLASDTTFYVTTIDFFGCESDREDVLVKVNPLPSQPVINDTTICEGYSPTLAIISPPPGPIEWYDAATGGNLIYTGDALTVSNPAAGVYKYYIQVTGSNGCNNNPREEVVLTVLPTPSAPTAPDQNVCENKTTTLTATGSTTDYEWFDSAAGGTLLSTSNPFTTGPITSDTTFYVLAKAGNGCRSDRSAVNLTLVPEPDEPAVSDTTICSGTSATLVATAPGDVYNWYSAVSGGSPLFTGSSFTTPQLNATTTYYVDATINGCTSGRSTVTVTVISSPATPQVNDTTICQNASASLVVTSPPGTYNWYDSPGATMPVYTGNPFNTGTLTATTSYFVEVVAANNCPSNARKQVTVTVNSLPASPSAQNTVICEGETATLTATAPGGIYSWYDNANNLVKVGSSYTTPPLSTTTAYFVEVKDAKGCTSAAKTEVTVTVTKAPEAPVVSDTAVCYKEKATLFATAAPGTIKWHTSATGGSVIFTGNPFETPALTLTTTYFVDVTLGCTSVNRTPVTVTVIQLPPVAVSPADTTICKGDEVTLTASGAFSYLWSDQSETETITVTPQSTTTYSVTGTDMNGCKNTAKAMVRVNALPVVDAGADRVICPGSSTTLIANGANFYEWDNGLGNGAFHVVSPATTILYKVKGTDGKNCSATDSVLITVDQDQNFEAGDDKQADVCANTNAFNLFTVIDTVNTQGRGRWLDTDKSGALTDSKNGLVDALKIKPLPGTYRFTFLIESEAGCRYDSAIATVTFHPQLYAGKDKQLAVCNTENALNLLTLLQTTETSGNWTQDPLSGVISQHQLDLTNDGVTGSPVTAGVYNYSYKVENTACPADSALLTLEVKEGPNPGGDSALSICSDDQSFRLMDALSGNPEANGSWTFSGGVVSGTNPDYIFDPAAQTVSQGIFVYTYKTTNNPSVCADSSARVTIRFQRAPSAGTSAQQAVVCQVKSPYNLFGSLNGTQDNYGQWTDDKGTGLLSGGKNELFDVSGVTFTGNSLDSVFTFTYRVPSLFGGCDAAETTVTVKVTRNPNPGENTSIIVCKDNSPFLLLDSLKGSPSANGTFSGNGPYSPADATAMFDPPAAAAGTYTITYTVPAGEGCNGSSTIKVTVNAAPNAGSDGDIEKCVSEKIIDLSGALSADADRGSDEFWTLEGGSSPAWLSKKGFIFTTDPSFPGCGSYKLLYHATAKGCDPDSALITVDVQCEPKAGKDAVLSVCTSDARTMLFDLVKPADTDGSWTDLDNSLGLVPGAQDHLAEFDPSMVQNTGVYKLLYIVKKAGCGTEDTSIVTAYVSKRPDPGSANAETACENNESFDLYTALGGNFDRKGTWTIDVQSPYDQKINTEVNSNRSVYFKGADQNLFNIKKLVAFMKGSSSPILSGKSNDQPPVIRFRYTVKDTTLFPGSPLCSDSMVFTTVEISKKFTAAAILDDFTEVCKENCAFNLNSVISHNFRKWSPTDKITWTAAGVGPQNIENDTIFRACDLDEGIYDFTVTFSSEGCGEVSTSGIKIKVVKQPSAGTSDTLVACQSETEVDLMDALTGDPTTGGSFTQISGPTIKGMKGSKIDATLNKPGQYQFEYTVSLAACPQSERSVATLIIREAPKSPGNIALEMCYTSKINLRDYMGSGVDQSGTFSAISCPTALQGSTFSSAVFDPQQDATLAAGGICQVVYTLNNQICPETTDTITISIQEPNRAGRDTTVTICQNKNLVNLLEQIPGNPTPGGTFSPNVKGLEGQSLNTEKSGPGVFVFTYITPSNYCPADSSLLTLTLEKTPQAGDDKLIMTCQEGTPINLFTMGLNGPRDQGGDFHGTTQDLTDLLSGASHEIMDPRKFDEGIYRFTYVIAGDICPDDSAVSTVIVRATPNAGRDTMIDLCSSSEYYHLFDALGEEGTDYDRTGFWSDINGVPVDPVINPSLIPLEGTSFIYAIVTDYCPTQLSTVRVNVSPQPQAGKDSSIMVCATSGEIILDRYIESFSPGGNWLVESGSPLGFSGNKFNPSANMPDTFQFKYMLEATGCPPDSALLTIVINKAPQSGVDTAVTICSMNKTLDLGALLRSPFDPGTFTAEPLNGTLNQEVNKNNALSGQLLHAGKIPVGNYVFTYTTKAEGCTDDKAMVAVNVVSPGHDTTLEACAGGPVLNLNSLTGTDPNGAGTFWSIIPNTIGVMNGSDFNPSKANLNSAYDLTIINNFPQGFNCPTKAQITVRDSLRLKTIEKQCNPNGTYFVIVTLTGGTPGKTTADMEGNISSYPDSTVFVSRNMPWGQPFEANFDNILHCNILKVEVGGSCTDKDGDTTADDLDLDDDNDGIQDRDESPAIANANADDDGDGTENYRDIDFCRSLGDNLSSKGVCSSLDFDQDGIINQFDLDSDNDGISDLVEAMGNNAVDLDGAIDGMVQDITDVNKNGWRDAAESKFTSGYIIPNTDNNTGQPGVDMGFNFLDIDSDNDQIADKVEAGPGAKISTLPVDTDGDQSYDYVDTDADNDKILDRYEASSDLFNPPNTDNDSPVIYDFRDHDADNDNIPDSLEARLSAPGTAPVDTDEEGDPDFQDIDSDNDRLIDLLEAGSNPADFPQDFDKNSKPDYIELDSDKDGIYDIVEGAPYSIPANSDQWDEPDYRSLDSDKDGIPDAIEGGPANIRMLNPKNTDGGLTFDFQQKDADSDGLIDSYEAGEDKLAPLDSDGDGEYDFQDTDSDDDCIPDVVEAVAAYDITFIPQDTLAYDFDQDGQADFIDRDSDNDGLDDFDEKGDCLSPVDSDSRSDNFPDFRDIDSDNDGLSDSFEKDLDCDNDGIPNFQDADGCDLTAFVPQGFSPNGDGVNDLLVIPGIESMGPTSVQVINRWGNVLYESSQYNNDWNGTHKGEPIPAGTYFLLVKFNGKLDYQGYLYINR